MAITAFTSTAIIDATTIGTTVLTASSAGIAADAIGLGATDDVTFNSVNSVDGDFSGKLSAVTVAGQTANLTLQSNSGASLVSLAESGSISITSFNTIYQQFTSLGVGYRKNCYPIFSTLDMGSAATPWNNGYFNNLSSGVGGSYKLYNLGAESDDDTEYLDFQWAADSAYIGTQSTGIGSNKNLYLQYGGQNRLLLTSTSVRTYRNFRPSNDNAYSSGESSARWSAVHTVDVQASTMTLSNLPTSDPAVAGQLWNDSGTVKISAG